MPESDDARAGAASPAIFEGIPGALDTLRESRLLRRLQPAQRDRVVAKLSVSRFDTGEPLLGRRDDADLDVHIVLSGEAKVYAGGDTDRGALLATVGRGALLGEYRAIMGSAGDVLVQASEPTVTGVLGRDDFLALIEAHPALALELLRQLISTIRELSVRVDEIQELGAAAENLRGFLFRASI